MVPPHHGRLSGERVCGAAGAASGICGGPGGTEPRVLQPHPGAVPAKSHHGHGCIQQRHLHGARPVLRGRHPRPLPRHPHRRHRHSNGAFGCGGPQQAVAAVHGGRPGRCDAHLRLRLLHPVWRRRSVQLARDPLVGGAAGVGHRGIGAPDGGRAAVSGPQRDGAPRRLLPLPAPQTIPAGRRCQTQGGHEAVFCSQDGTASPRGSR
mmetsp:Transcript_6734/g.19363  ORF Transcript_6734/g.19363 Transcript_6734/m.19363 type:complete len:207 (-) Transcript_6734:1254-1874(-)